MSSAATAWTLTARR